MQICSVSCRRAGRVYGSGGGGGSVGTVTVTVGTVTVTVGNDKALFETDGGVRDELKRIRPDVYYDNFQIGFAQFKIDADFSSRPKRLNVQTYEGDCKWTATAP